jgi:hypothetical protein
MYASSKKIAMTSLKRSLRWVRSIHNRQLPLQPQTPLLAILDASRDLLQIEDCHKHDNDDGTLRFSGPSHDLAHTELQR